ncbi:MAG: MBL fold metallo-hydrolase [Syntrophomonadales bacterium]|jgi:glyoxylase-like metal-dependent hydrolase (beta-lactamase superfamily II)
MLFQVGRKVYVVFNEDGYTYGNCMLVEDDVRLLIDSGAGRELDKVQPENIDILINTHHHYDHVRDNELFTRARVLLHPTEHPSIQDLEKVMAVHGWDELMSHKLSDMQEVNPNDLPEPWRVDGEINDGQVIDCGSTKFVVLHTPGHSKGHCAFYFPEEDLVFLGDICLTRVGPWYGEADADLNEFIDSINRIIEMKPGRVVTSHVNQVFDNPGVVLSEYRDRILKREKRILREIKANPSTIDQLADKHLIYRQHPSLPVLFWEKSMLKNHLQRMIKLGLVKEIDNGVYGSK